MITSIRKLKEIVRKAKKEGKRIVFTNGCFDIIHVGHIRLLRRCRELGDIVIVGVNSDLSVRRLKGNTRPINKVEDRTEILSAIRYVDFVIVFEEDTPYNLIKQIEPDFLVKGGDYKEDEVVGREFAKKVVIFPLVKGKSTTSLIKKIHAFGD